MGKCNSCQTDLKKVPIPTINGPIIIPGYHNAENNTTANRNKGERQEIPPQCVDQTHTFNMNKKTKND